MLRRIDAALEAAGLALDLSTPAAIAAVLGVVAAIALAGYWLT